MRKEKRMYNKFEERNKEIMHLERMKRFLEADLEDRPTEEKILILRQTITAAQELLQKCK